MPRLPFIQALSLKDYQAIWKPPRAPTSPEFRPMPTPPDTDAFGPTRAVNAAEPAARFWK